MSEPSIPAAVTRWATAPLDAGDLVEPDNDTKDEGWHEAQEPAHSFLNYWMNVVYLWLVYLDGLPAEAMTWTGAHIFNNAVTMNAGLTANTANVTGTLTTNDLNVTDDLDVNGTLDVADLATFHGGLTLPAGEGSTLNCEDANLTGEVDVGTLIASGNTTLSSNLTIVGSTSAGDITATTLTSTGEVISGAGNDVISGDEFVHDTVQTRRKFVSVLDFVFDDQRTEGSQNQYVWDLDVDGQSIYCELPKGSDGNRLAAQIEVPMGADITRIDLLMRNTNAFSVTFDVTVVKHDAAEDDTTVLTPTIMNAGNATSNLSIGGSAAKAWVEVPLDGSFHPAPNGFLSIRIDNANDDGPFLFGARVRYAYDTPRPAV